MSQKFSVLFQTFGKIGILSFGGPAAQIALMHRVLVAERRWLDEKQFLSALSFCMLLPGPEAMQLATYSGWRVAGVLGGLLAGLLFVLPGAMVVLALAAFYVAYGASPVAEAIFLGVKAAVILIVIEALVKLSKRALKNKHHWALAAFAFLGIFFLNIPFPLIVILAGLFGALAAKPEPASLPINLDYPVGNTVRTVLLWLCIWLSPLVFLWLFTPESLLVSIGFFFSKLAVVTFGGAYAVLGYMAQDVVSGFGWLTAGEMMDALGLAETTPGPLILVTEFVGFLAGFKQEGPGLAVAAAALTLWVTFAPCFLWIFAGAPYLDWISAQPRLNGALAAITAAVVGVILNLSLWFALHVFFKEVTAQSYGVFVLWQPGLSSLDVRPVVISLVCAFLLFRFGFSLPSLLGLAAIMGLGMNAFSGFLS